MNPNARTLISLRGRFVSLSLTVVLLASFAVAQASAPSPSAVADLDARTAVELANDWRGNGVTTFATPKALHFAFPDGAEARVAMPDDVMLVSVAPYLSQTHPCSTHYLSGCQGELVDAPVHVKATLPDGTTVLDEVVRTLPNGFLDLWLPRDQAIDLRLSLIEGYSTSALVTTFDDSPTCVTDMQLARAGR